MLPLPSAWAYETRLSIEAGIPKLWDNVVPVISGTGADTVCSFSPQCWPDGPVSVSECFIGAYGYTDRIESPGYGSRLRPRLLGRYFKDPGACLRYGTTD